MTTNDVNPEPEAGEIGVSARGRLRRIELLQVAIEYLLAEGLAEFSLRQVAKRAGTSHRMVLYHFGSSRELLRAALIEIRRPFLEHVVGAETDPLAFCVQLLTDESPTTRVLVEGMLLAALEPETYADLGRDYKDAYLPIITERLPPHLKGQARADMAELVLAAFRGASLDARTAGDPAAAVRALTVLNSTIIS